MANISINYSRIILQGNVEYIYFKALKNMFLLSNMLCRAWKLEIVWYLVRVLVWLWLFIAKTIHRLTTPLFQLCVVCKFNFLWLFVIYSVHQFEMSIKWTPLATGCIISQFLDKCKLYSTNSKNNKCEFCHLTKNWLKWIFVDQNFWVFLQNVYMC